MESEDLITAFKSANQSLRKRAIALGVLMTLAVALRYSENVRYEKVSDLVEYQYGLEQVAGLPDSTFQKVMNDYELQERYFPLFSWNEEMYARDRLFEKVKVGGYRKDLVYDAIDEIDQKVEDFNRQQSISILGLTIPLAPVAYLSLVFVLIVFHDFTQIIIIRNQIYRRIRNRNLPRWKLGFEFFGFYNPANSSTLRFVKFTSSIITAALIICPLVTSILMMNLNNSNSVLLLLLNVVCFLLIVIDTILIFHTENIANFRYCCNFYLGRHRTGALKMRLIWGFPLLLLVMINLAVGAVLTAMHGMPGIVYFLMSLIPPIPLFIWLIRTQRRPTKINRAIRAGLLILNVFWLLVTLQALFVIDRLSPHAIDELAEVFVGMILLSAAYAFLYMKFFMDHRRAGLKVPNRIMK